MRFGLTGPKVLTRGDREPTQDFTDRNTRSRIGTRLARGYRGARDERRGLILKIDQGLASLVGVVSVFLISVLFNDSTIPGFGFRKEMSLGRQLGHAQCAGCAERPRINRDTKRLRGDVRAERFYPCRRFDFLQGNLTESCGEPPHRF